MNILVVNDDGIQSPGINNLVQALSKVADVYVCAPDGQRSAKSHSITLNDKVYVTPALMPGAKEAYMTTGTPADCTKIGLQFFEEAGIHMDLVYSGINIGSNLGRDTLYSGTIGAAAEAALSGYKAVAVSVDSHQATHFDRACEMAVSAMSFACEKMEAGLVLSINVPDIPAEDIKGTRIATLGPRYYDDKFYESEDGGYQLSGEPNFVCHDERADSNLISQGYATVTLLQFDFTAYDKLKELEGIAF